MQYLHMNTHTHTEHGVTRGRTPHIDHLPCLHLDVQILLLYTISHTHSDGVNKPLIDSQIWRPACT